VTVVTVPETVLLAVSVPDPVIRVVAPGSDSVQSNVTVQPLTLGAQLLAVPASSEVPLSVSSEIVVSLVLPAGHCGSPPVFVSVLE
jgi:hypothetical protein